MDEAILEASEERQQAYLSEYEKIDEIPFDFKRKRMSVVIKKGTEELLISKGSLATILASCSFLRKEDAIQPIDAASLEQIHALHDDLNNKGLRVLAVAYRNVAPLHKTTFIIEDESQLILAGFLSFLDPPKSSAAAALKQLALLNIDVKVLTGDNEVITQRICDWVHLRVEGVLTGPEIQKLSETELAAQVKTTTIFAKLEPLQKSQIIAF